MTKVTTTTTAAEAGKSGGGMTEGAAVAVAEIKATLRGLVLSVVVLTVLLLGVVGFGYYQSRSIHSSLCTFRGDLQARIEQSRTFLHQPAVLKQFGFTVAELQVQIDNQQRTVDALDDLNC